MAQSLKNRFNGNTQEVLQYTRLFGQRAAMLKFKHPGTVCLDGIAFRGWLKDVAGDENYGLNPQMSGLNIPRGQNPIEYVFSRLADSMVDLKGQLAEKNERIKSLEDEVAVLTESQTSHITSGLLAVLQVCNE